MGKVYIIGKDAVPTSLKVGSGEQVDMTLVVLPGTSCRLDMDVEITGPDASVAISGLYVCGSDEKVGISVRLAHTSGGSISRQLFKGIVGGKARADFDGLIVVAQDSQKTEAYQSTHNLLLSPQAKADARPQLEIYADDVKCSHGATIGRLNEEEQFYMRSRGISLAEAKVLQMISFISPVIDTIADQSEREEVRSVIEGAIRDMVR